MDSSALSRVISASTKRPCSPNTISLASSKLPRRPPPLQTPHPHPLLPPPLFLLPRLLSPPHLPLPGASPPHPSPSPTSALWPIFSPAWTAPCPGARAAPSPPKITLKLLRTTLV